MVTLHITKTGNGFITEETKEAYIFQPYIIDEEGNTVDNQILNSTTALVGTNKAIILLNTDCSVDDVIYATIEEFLTALYQ
jgi:hypothetical protein